MRVWQHAESPPGCSQELSDKQLALLKKACEEGKCTTAGFGDDGEVDALSQAVKETVEVRPLSLASHSLSHTYSLFHTLTQAFSHTHSLTQVRIPQATSLKTVAHNHSHTLARSSDGRCCLEQILKGGGQQAGPGGVLSDEDVMKKFTEQLQGMDNDPAMTVTDARY
eukprot:1337709-Rhodomonas_salina.2